MFTTKDGRKITLRPLEKGDLDPLVVFANRLAREKRTNLELGIVSLERRMSREDERKFLNATLKGVAEKRFVSMAAFEGRTMVGNCDISGRTFRDEKHTGVLGLVIVDGYRGVGLGEALIRRALEFAAKVGIWIVELTVFETNGPARRLYEKVGFEEIGVVPKKIHRGDRYIDEVRMYIHLPHSERRP